jgi:hypothetical protein
LAEFPCLAAPVNPPRDRRGSRPSRLEHAAQDFGVFGDLAVHLDQFLDLANAVKDRRVIAATELAPDLGQGAGGQLLAQNIAT